MSEKIDKKELVGDEMELEQNDDDSRMNEGEFNASSNDQNIKTVCGYKLQGMTLVIITVLGISTAITIAFILDIIFGTRPTKFHGAVSSDSSICSEKGLTILKNGGNAIDSAVVTALCLSLVRPDVVSLGGCGQLILLEHRNMSSSVFDGQCSVPAELVSSVPDSIGSKGEQSIGVPGMLPMLFRAHSSYGRLKWSSLVDSVINISSDAVQVSSQMEMSNSVYSDSNIGELPASFSAEFKKSSFKPDPKLSALLKQIAKAKSLDDITTGSFAEEILAAAKKNQGKMTAEDIKSYDVNRTDTIKGHFSGLTILTSSKSSWGGPFIGASLNILNEYSKKTGLANDPSSYHIMVEVFKQVQLKAASLGDTESAKSLLDTMLSDKFVKEVKSTIKSAKIFNISSNFVPFSTERHKEIILLGKQTSFPLIRKFKFAR